MQLSDVLKTIMSSDPAQPITTSSGIDVLLRRAEDFKVLVHIKKSPVPIDQLDVALAVINAETNRFVCEAPVVRVDAPLPRDNSQGAYWEVNHNPWLD